MRLSTTMRQQPYSNCRYPDITAKAKIAKTPKPWSDPLNMIGFGLSFGVRVEESFSVCVCVCVRFSGFGIQGSGVGCLHKL